MARWRIGTVPYLVARPLTEGLASDPQVELTVAPPARLAELLHAGELDVALASSVLATGPQPLALWAGGPVIASAGPVRSVLLLLRPGVGALAEVRRWIADPHSRTGQALAGILLEGSGAVRVEADREDLFAAAELADADAVQAIGDPALAAAAAHPDWTVVDLGAEWYRRTGLPFVFAAWIGRPGFDPASAAEPLAAAAARGLARRDEFAVEGARTGPGDEAFYRRYLGEDLCYRLPEEQVRASLREFDSRLGSLHR